MKQDLRIGQIVGVEELIGYEYVTHKLRIDLGTEFGTKTSMASLVRYSAEQLQGRLVVCIVNLPPKQIGEHLSEVIVLGAADKDNHCVLISPDSSRVMLGSSCY